MSEYKRYSNETFKSLISQGELPIKACIGKGLLDTEYRAAKADDGSEDRVREFIASTADVDHEGDTISVKGWDLKTYKKAGSFLWAHDRLLSPVATPLKIWRDEEALRLQVRFPEEDFPHQFGEGFGYSVMRMYDEGLLKGVSVGFNPKDFRESTDENRKSEFFWPIDYIKQVLLEVSAVPVPANPFALNTARSKGISVAPLQAWAEEYLDLRSTGSRIFTKDLVQRFLDSGSGPDSGAPTTVMIGGSFDEPKSSETKAETDSELVLPVTDDEMLPVTDASVAVDVAWDTESMEKTYIETIEKAVIAESDLIDRLKKIAQTVSDQGKLLSEDSEKKVAGVICLLSDLLPTKKEGESQEENDSKKANKNKSLTKQEFQTLVHTSLKAHLDKLTGQLPTGE